MLSGRPFFGIYHLVCVTLFTVFREIEPISNDNYDEKFFTIRITFQPKCFPIRFYVNFCSSKHIGNWMWDPWHSIKYL